MRWVWKELSQREKKICLRHVRDGQGYKEIAWELGISLSTVKHILCSIYRLMDMQDHIELAWEMGKRWKELRK